MADPFTIRIFVPDGDPEGVRLIDRMNWTGLGLVFRRADWEKVQNFEEIHRTGIYILVGYRNEEDDLVTLYIGQADGVRSRIDSHYKNKDFWDWAVVFVSSSQGLNRAHVTWLEYALVKRAMDVDRCKLDNGNTPQEPALTQDEKADTKGFLKEIMQILPLVGLRAFEFPKVVTPSAASVLNAEKQRIAKIRDTIVVPAKKEGFEDVFLSESCWYAIRISGGMINKIRYIAAYQVHPVSAITHYAPVARIEPYGDAGKYKVVFSESAKSIEPIPYGDAPLGAMQAPRYTSFTKLQSAKQLSDLLPWQDD